MNKVNVIRFGVMALVVAHLGCDASNAPPAEGASEDLVAWKSPSGKAPPTIVLVHGAFADGTGWQKVIPLLERDGYPVVAVQNPLTSIADDVATTKRVIDAASTKGTVVVVGHSFGGAVITAAAADNANVRALVYVDAFVPDAGEVLGSLLEKFGPGPLAQALVPDAAGFLYIDRARFKSVFCDDVTDTEAHVMAAVQKPINSAVLGAVLDKAAWKTTPSWYMVGTDDQVISPELQHFMAARINAHVTEIRSSHVPFISRPRAVVRMIEQAATSTAN